MGEIEKVFNWETFITGGALATLVSALGGYDAMLKIVLIAMALDWITGLVKAVKLKSLTSRTGFNGVLRKGTMLMVIAFGTALDEAFNIQGETINARSLLLMFYLGNEAISMLENVEALGVPVPNKLREILVQCRNKGNDS